MKNSRGSRDSDSDCLNIDGPGVAGGIVFGQAAYWRCDQESHTTVRSWISSASSASSTASTASTSLTATSHLQARNEALLIGLRPAINLK